MNSNARKVRLRKAWSQWVPRQSSAPGVTARPKRSYLPVRLNWSEADGTPMGIPLQKKDLKKVLPRALSRNLRAIELLEFERSYTSDKKIDCQIRYVKASYPTFPFQKTSNIPPTVFLLGDDFFPRLNYAFLRPISALSYQYRCSPFSFPMNTNRPLNDSIAILGSRQVKCGIKM